MLLIFTGLAVACSFKHSFHFLAVAAAIFSGVSLPTVLSYSKRLKTFRALILFVLSFGSLFIYDRLPEPWGQLVWQLFVISYYFAFASIYLFERRAERVTEADEKLARFALRADLNKIFSKVRNLQPSSETSIPVDATRLSEHAHIASVFSRNGWEVEMRFERREGVVLFLRAPSTMKQMDKSLTNISCEAC